MGSNLMMFSVMIDFVGLDWLRWNAVAVRPSWPEASRLLITSNTTGANRFTGTRGFKDSRDP